MSDDLQRDAERRLGLLRDAGLFTTTADVAYSLLAFLETRGIITTHIANTMATAVGNILGGDDNDPTGGTGGGMSGGNVIPFPKPGTEAFVIESLACVALFCFVLPPLVRLFGSSDRRQPAH